MIGLRMLNEKGTDEFVNYIQRIKQGVKEDPPIDSLSKPLFSREFKPSIKIVKKK